MQRYGERPPDVDEPDADRAARGTIRFLAVALFVAVVAVVLRLTLLSLDEEPSAGTGGNAGGGRAAPVAAVVVEDLGPEPGVDVAAYARNRRAALEAAKGERLAVVSLGSYATQSQVRDLIGATPVIALLVAPPGMAPTVVVGDLGTWTNAQTKALREERDEISKLIPTVTDQAFKAFYTSEVERLSQAATALSPAAPIVFGVVVRGQVQALQTLGGRPEVRLVDVADGAEPAPKATYRGLRPEERVKANDPSARPE